MRKCYTISSLKSLKELPRLDTVQFTLNSRTFPAKRETVKALSQVSKTSDTDIIVHYDFIYIISRFKMFSESVREAIINEVVSIIEYASTDSRIKGIVMHTDYPIKKEVLKEGLQDDVIKSLYKASIWNSAILDSVKHSDTILYDSIYLFAEYLSKRVSKPSCKIYLENTTKCFHSGFSVLGSAKDLVSLLQFDDSLKEYFGVCYDTEHAFAVTGTDYDVYDFVKDCESSDISMMVHMNCIPEEVLAFSNKDRHSFTTIFDCSLHLYEYYLQLSDFLDSKKIPWVREVHTETMLEEIKKLETL